MKYILKAKWGLLLLWLAATVLLVITAPSMTELVREKGEITVPKGYSSEIASRILNTAAEQEGDGRLSHMALVFHRNGGMTADDKKDIEGALTKLRASMGRIGISSIVDPFDTPEAEDKMIASDGKTLLAQLSVQMDKRPLKEIEQDIRSELSSLKVDHYLTGDQQINQDVILSAERGLKKSEYFTVIFILVILFIVFRSAVAPFIPLLTVGISYLISQSIVAFLIDQYNFPVSTYTQIFMVAVMFGIGTDYCILLISRFKEELQLTDNIPEAIIQTYRKAGKTVFFSGLAVLVGFTTIGLSQFVLYRSAVAVAVGIAVMLLALITIVPFFMAVLGKRLFWPMKGTIEHKDNRFWGGIGTFSIKKPWAAALLVAVFTVPFIISYSNNVSFNSMEEIGEQYESVKAYNLIADSFEPGESLPATIVIKSDQTMDDPEDIMLAEKISRAVMEADGVASVRSLSRPTGEIQKDFELTNQVKTVGEGLGEGNEGLSQIKNGLAEASQALNENEPKLTEAAESTGKLVAGTAALKEGIAALSNGLSEIQKGITDSSKGAGGLKQGMKQLKQSAEELTGANSKLLQSYRLIAAGLGSLGEGYQQIQQQLGEIAKGFSQLDASFANLEQKYPELASDKDYLTIRGTVAASGQGLEQLAVGLGTATGQLQQVKAGLEQANSGYAEAAKGSLQLAGGLDQFISGLSQLEQGLNKAGNGQGQIVKKLPEIVDGLSQIQQGQEQIQDGFSQFSGQITQLTDGLDQSVEGLGQVSGGLDTAKQYLSEVGANDHGLGGYYVPREAMENEAIDQLFDTYLSPDRKVMTLDVVFSSNPYGREAIDQISEVQAAVDKAVAGTKLGNAEIAIGGVSSTFNDLKTISDADYTRTVIFMLAGIFIVLLLLLRSVVMPIYIIASLVLTFFASVGFTEIIFVDLLGYSGVSWATPFFGFVILVALGVDYSIFLMDRFNEHGELDISEAMVHSMRKMGTVILSAAVILGGTMASMYPSGVLSMLQISTLVLTGLFLYAVIVLPFLMPVFVRIFGKANWWPFRREHGHAADQSVDM
ncbi:MMPL family transporter [Paenibacillus aceti]|uniref:Transporter n=1 Tax=Paenibacillus aceti TaxID=1820010 RepID=A0ABQ1W2T1_9BACL|nr:MMPL family transporter [Paenibacillus aceti]GGG12110.1 transporter [Paenibacillus aceti]